MVSVSYVVSATDAMSAVMGKIGLSVDNLDRQLEDLSKRIATPEVDLKDAKFTLGMVNAAKRLDKLSAMVADPSVTVDTTKAQLEILRITAMLDRLDAKRVTVTAGAGGGFLRALAGLGGTAGAAAPGLGGIGAGLAAGPLLVGLAQITGALAAAGAGVAAFAALSVPQFHAVGQSLQQINTDTAAYERATTKASKSLALKHIQQDWADISPPQRQAVRGIQSLQAEFAKLSAKLAPVTFRVFNEGLKIANNLLPAMLPFARAAGNAIDGLLKGLNKFVTPAPVPKGPLGAKENVISGVPSLTPFQQFMAQLQALSGPAITALGKGLGQITIALGKLILVAASPDSIRTLSRVLGFLAATVNVVSWSINRISGNMQKWVDIAHQTAGKFDEFRHDTARVFAAVATVFDEARHRVAVWGHDVAVTFDVTRHLIAVSWNQSWNDTVGRTARGVADVTGWFRGLPGRVLGALRGLGHSLAAFASAAMGEMWDAFKRVGGSITNWLTGFWHGIVGIAHKILGVFSPSAVFYDIGRNLMLGLQAGVKDHAHLAVNAASAAAHRVADAGSGVQRWAGLVRRALAMEGLAPGLLGNVLFQMSTESGGNVNAINLGDINARMGDPSRGLMQVIGSTFAAYHWPGTSSNIYDPLANIAAALNYARHVYGPSLMSGGMGIGSGHGYAAGSWNVPYTGPAVVHQGEMIIPAGAAAAVRAGGGGTVNVYVQVGHGTHPVAAAQEIAKVLNAGAMSGVKLRSSILGPG